MVSKKAGKIPEGEGGGGGTHQVLYREAPAPSSDPLPFYIPFFMKKGPLFIHLVLTNGTPFFFQVY